MTIVYTSHYMEEVEAICDELAVIDRGRVVAREPVDKLLQMAAAKSLQLTFEQAPPAGGAGRPCRHSGGTTGMSSLTLDNATDSRARSSPACRDQGQTVSQVDLWHGPARGHLPLAAGTRPVRQLAACIVKELRLSEPRHPRPACCSSSCRWPSSLVMSLALQDAFDARAGKGFSVHGPRSPGH